MRYPASEKLEIIRGVERSHLPKRRTLAMFGILRTTHFTAGTTGTSPWVRRVSRISPRARDALEPHS